MSSSSRDVRWNRSILPVVVVSPARPTGILGPVPEHPWDEITPRLGVTLVNGWAGTIEHEFSDALWPQFIPGGPGGGEALRARSAEPGGDEVGLDERIRIAARKAFRGRKAYLRELAPPLYIANAKIKGGTVKHPTAGCILHASMEAADVRG